MALTGITLRQLQWWDERSVIPVSALTSRDVK